MSYPIFTGIFLDEESKEAVHSFMSRINIKPYDHVYCKHITVNHRPDFEEILFSESEPVVGCYLTAFVQDPYIQTFKVSIPFPHKKKLPHLTYSVADDEDHRRYGGNPRPLAKPHYSNHLLKHLELVEMGRTARNPEVVVIDLTTSELHVIPVRGSLITVKESSPYRPRGGVAARYV